MDSFLKYYKSFESRPVFETVEEMLKWSGLYNMTKRTLQEELLDAGLSPRLIQELVTVRRNLCSTFSMYDSFHFNMYPVATPFLLCLKLAEVIPLSMLVLDGNSCLFCSLLSSFILQVAS